MYLRIRQQSVEDISFYDTYVVTLSRLRASQHHTQPAAVIYAFDDFGVCLCEFCAPKLQFAQTFRQHAPGAQYTITALLSLIHLTRHSICLRPT